MYGWFLVAAGRGAEAVALGAELRRALGHQAVPARLQAALLAEAAARRSGDIEAAMHAADTVTAVRRHGFALVIAEAARMMPATAPPRLRVRLVGPVRIERDGRDMPAGDWRSQKARLALLLAAAGQRGLRREELVELVWPGRGRTLLRTALAELRRVLEPDRPAGAESAYLSADRDRVRLAADVDLVTARAHAAAGRDAAALALLSEELAVDEPDDDALTVLRDEAATLRLRVADRIAANESLPTAQRAAALETVLAVQSWRTDLAERLVALWWRAGDPERARAADARYLFH